MDVKRCTALCVMGLVFNVARGVFVQDYMTSSCGDWLSSRVSGRLETSTSLTYDNNMDCVTSISVADDKMIRLVVKRFEVEEPISGDCLDHVSVYDGLTDSFPVLIDRMCGTIAAEFTFNTSSNHVTFRFVSDATAVYRGFDVEYTSFSYPPCASGEFECTSGFCIDAGNTCDDVTQCGDYSDESQCSEEAQLPSTSQADLPLIIGATLAGLALLILIVIIGVKVYHYLKWKAFKQEHEHWSAEDLYSYPVTDRYNKYRIGQKGRRQPRHVIFYDNPRDVTFRDDPDVLPSSSKNSALTVDETL